MTQISAFSLTCKSVLSYSGVCIKLSQRGTNKGFKLYRRFEDSEELLLCEIVPNIATNKIITFKIGTKIRDIHSLIHTVNSKIKESLPENSEIFDQSNNLNTSNSLILKTWQSYFKSEDFINEFYNGYMILDKQKRLWIYDIVPAVQAFAQIDENNKLPVPGSTVTYRVVSIETEEELFLKKLTIPDFIPGDLHLHDIFEKDIYLYHLGLFKKDNCIWGRFTSKTSKKKLNIIQEAAIGNNDLLCNITPDISALPKLKASSQLFKLTANPPSISQIELLETNLRISRIKTDTGKSNNFNFLTFETKVFKSSSFPKTLFRIFPC